MFKIKKRIELVKTIGLNTRIDIFDKKIGRKVKLLFLFNDVKLPEQFIYHIKLVQKCLIRGALAKLYRKVSFGGPMGL